MKTITKLLLFILVISINIFSQSNNGDRWEGAIEIMGTELIIIVNFTTTDEAIKATIDIPQQGAFNLQLINVRYEDEAVYFELPAGPGLAVFDGIRDGDKITGKFSQAGITGTFYLNRVEVEDEVIEKEPPPYHEENVYIHNEDIRLGCTLTIPFDDGPYPAVILITGSGAQDRDETVFGFKPFQLLTDHLTPNGIAVLRCDDRGVGESTGSVSASTSKDFAGDVEAKFRFLREREEINPHQIGLLGHSEGGIIAAMVAAENQDIAFVVSMAGTAMLGRDILIAQTELIFDATGMNEIVTHKQVEMINRIYDSVKTGEGWDEIESFAKELAALQVEQMPDEQRVAIEEVDQYVEQQIKMGLAAIKSEWYKFFIAHDPAEDLRQVTQPVLGLFAELDLQVPPEMNKNAMREALEYAENQDYTLVIIPHANHLFQKAKTGSPTEYAQLEKEFIDGFLDIVLDWIKVRVQ